MSKDEKHSNQSATLASQYVKLIDKIASRYRPLILVIEDAHWIDNVSCDLLQRLAAQVSNQPLLIIVTYRPSYLGDGHPLNKVRYETLSKKISHILSLKGLSKEHVESYIKLRFSNTLNPLLADWLMYLSSGHPLFVSQYLSLLEQENIVRRVNGLYVMDGEIKIVAGSWELSGQLSQLEIPESIEALLEQRIRRLQDEDQELLQIGAAQGEYFYSTVLANFLNKDESDILKRLRKVLEQHRLIQIYTGTEIIAARSEVYSFEHNLLQQALYNKLSPRERVLYHRNIAKILENVFLNDQVLPSRKMILEIAFHFDKGEEFLSAARYYLNASQSLFANGANIESVEISKRALKIIRRVRNEDSLLVEIIELLLLAELSRENILDEDYDLSVMGLVREAETAAKRTGIPALLARVKFLQASFLHRYMSLNEALVAIKEAQELIHNTGDPLSEFVILSEQGHLLRGQDFESGIAMQHQARQFFKEKIIDAGIELSLDISRLYHIRQLEMGVAEFDRGNFEVALELLEESVAYLKNQGLKDARIPGMNYLAQLYISMGLFSQAEVLLQEALIMAVDNDEAHHWNGYNLCLLGKLYLESGRVEAAEDPILQGWKKSQATQIKWLVPIVRNYYVELLMNSGSKVFNLKEAENQLNTNLEESRLSGHHGCTVASLFLLGQVALMQNHSEQALDASSQAVQILDRMGTLPALRSEEVYFDHYSVLQAAGRSKEAQIYLEKARLVLEQKTDSILTEDYKKSFLSRVHINRKILAELGK